MREANKYPSKMNNSEYILFYMKKSLKFIYQLQVKTAHIESFPHVINFLFYALCLVDVHETAQFQLYYLWYLVSHA